MGFRQYSAGGLINMNFRKSYSSLRTQVDKNEATLLRANGGNAVTNRGKLIDDFHNLAAWVVTDGQTVLDNSYVRHGSMGIKLTNLKTDETLGAWAKMDKTVDIDMSTMTSMSLVCYVPDVTDIAELKIFLANEAELTNLFRASRTVYQGWNTLTFSKKEIVSAQGTPSWASNIKVIRISVGNVATHQFDIYLDAIINDVVATPMCLITFDGGFLGQYSTALPILQAAGMCASSFLVSSIASNPPIEYMSTAQALELEAAGWYIGNHSTTHADPAPLTEAQFKAEVSVCRDWLLSSGFKSESVLHYVYPYGHAEPQHFQWLKDLGVISARATIYGQQSYIGLDDDIYKLKCYPVANATLLATVQNKIDYAIESNSTCIIYLHNVLPDLEATGENDVSQTVFQGIVDYLIPRMNILTVHEWYQIVTNQKDLVSRI
jgi:peptidoglycan/xylan/chitin deacetylase (PgdA/CDA1 family)